MKTSKSGRRVGGSCPELLVTVKRATWFNVSELDGVRDDIDQRVGDALLVTDTAPICSYGCAVAFSRIRVAAAEEGRCSTS